MLRENMARSMKHGPAPDRGVGSHNNGAEHQSRSPDRKRQSDIQDSFADRANHQYLVDQLTARRIAGSLISFTLPLQTLG